MKMSIRKKDTYHYYFVYYCYYYQEGIQLSTHINTYMKKYSLVGQKLIKIEIWNLN